MTTPSLFLHSSLSTSQQWNPLIGQLNTTPIVNIDLIGYGANPIITTMPVTKHTLQDEIDRFSSKLECQKYHIIGHSFGAAIALKFAHLYPEKVASLSLFEPVAFYLLSDQDPVNQAMAAHFSTFTQDAPINPQACAMKFIDFWNGDGSFSRLPPKMQTRFTQQIIKVAMDFQAISHDPLNLNTLNIQCPTLLIQGHQTQPAMKGLMAALSNRFQVKVNEVDGGHMAPITNPKQVNQLIAGHIL
jgi:pimeloyl-ACP methyl ester carboxylesterase